MAGTRIFKGLPGVVKLAASLTFQTGERCGLFPRCLVGKCKIGQTETGAMVLVQIA